MFIIPAGWPASIIFFAVTVVVYLLQRFPLTGIFLMILAAPFWSTVLINLGMAGIVVEVLGGKVRPEWLLLPLIYVGGYYTLYALERRAAAALIAETGTHNAAQHLPFDPELQDLVIGDAPDGGLAAQPFIKHYPLARVFDDHGRMMMVIDPEARKLLANNRVLESAKIRVNALANYREQNPSQAGILTMPGKPDRPQVEVKASWMMQKRGSLPLKLVETRITDIAARRSVVVRSGDLQLLKPYPMWAMGCGLNSGQAKWQCFHGFMRDRIGLAPNTRPFQGPDGIVAAVLGLAQDDDPDARAVSAAVLQPLIDEKEQAVAAGELRIVEHILAEPQTPAKDSWLWHLPNRPELTAPLVHRIIDALGTMSSEKRLSGENARQLWRLLATQDDRVLAPHRARIVEFLRGERSDRGYDAPREFLHRLDVRTPEEREILLGRIEVLGGDLPIDVLPGFCRLGADAPSEAKQRLLAVWRRRGEPKKGHPEQRDSGDAMLYFVLARMGLKAEAGKVEQFYYGPTFTAVWERVGPDLPVEQCPSTMFELDLWQKGRWPG